MPGGTPFGLFRRKRLTEKGCLNTGCREENVLLYINFCTFPE